ncbi:MAG: PorV/PorQ family protein [Endomicrobiales bacterium]
MHKKFALLILALGTLTPDLWSLNLGFAREDGGVPGAFLSFGAGARSLAMGKTFVGVADDASAVYWNPAGLTQLKTQDITALYASLYDETAYSFISYARPVAGSGAIGIAVVNLNSGGFQLRDEFNYDTGIASLNETAAIISYAKTLWYGSTAKGDGGRLSAGINLKAVNQNIDSTGDTGYGMDLGLFWSHCAAESECGSILAPLSIGLSLQNVIAPSLKLRNEADTYPLGVTLGFGYRFFEEKLLLALDINQISGRQLKMHLGGEYVLNKLIAFRVGLDETELTSGLGFKWNNYSLDYAFAYHDAWSANENLGISHRFGLTIKFQ